MSARRQRGLAKPCEEQERPWPAGLESVSVPALVYWRLTPIQPLYTGHCLAVVWNMTGSSQPRDESVPNSVSSPPCLQLREESQPEASCVHRPGKPVAGNQSNGTG